MNSQYIVVPLPSSTKCGGGTCPNKPTTTILDKTGTTRGTHCTDCCAEMMEVFLEVEQETQLVADTVKVGDIVSWSGHQTRVTRIIPGIGVETEPIDAYQDFIGLSYDRFTFECITIVD